jgi:hypothetical protein
VADEAAVRSDAVGSVTGKSGRVIHNAMRFPHPADDNLDLQPAVTLCSEGARAFLLACRDTKQHFNLINHFRQVC